MIAKAAFNANKLHMEIILKNLRVSIGTVTLVLGETGKTGGHLLIYCI